jgi:hypothetical protein
MWILSWWTNHDEESLSNEIQDYDGNAGRHPFDGRSDLCK